VEVPQSSIRLLIKTFIWKNYERSAILIKTWFVDSCSSSKPESLSRSFVGKAFLLVNIKDFLIDRQLKDIEILRSIFRKLQEDLRIVLSIDTFSYKSHDRLIPWSCNDANSFSLPHVFRSVIHYMVRHPRRPVLADLPIQYAAQFWLESVFKNQDEMNVPGFSSGIEKLHHHETKRCLLSADQKEYPIEKAAARPISRTCESFLCRLIFS
jgi:hypothetical protein